MKSTKALSTSAILCISLISLSIGTGCSRYKHQKEEKEIKRERYETDKAGSDLNAGVLVTDSLGWDAVRDYALFKDSVTKRINICKKNIAAYKTSVRNRQGKIPVIYRHRISKLEQKSSELEHRIGNYVIKEKSDWEDFCKLFSYDLTQLENSVRKLTHKPIAMLSLKWPAFYHQGMSLLPVKAKSE